MQVNNQLLANYYSLHRDELVSFIAVRIVDTNEAEDIVQDIFLRLLRGQHLITPQTLPSLLHTMARQILRVEGIQIPCGDDDIRINIIPITPNFSF